MSTAKDIGIIGAGAWGCAVAKCLGEAGHRVQIWAYETEVCDEINQKHTNGRYLPGVDFSAKVTASNKLAEVASGKRFLIFATPSLHTLPAVKSLISVPDILEGRTIIGVLTKGFITTPRGPRMMLQAMEDYLPGIYKDSLVYISGPSHAEEVARGKLTGLIAASRNPLNSVRFRNLLNTHPLMVFSSTDIVGVQVSAAVKNVVAIAFGILDAIKETSPIVGDNTESLLLAAGLNEIQNLAAALGSTHPSKTLTSIAGVGDLDVTCRSIHGRNRRFGREIVLKGIIDPYRNIDEVIANFAAIGYLPEGAAAVRFVKDYIDQYNLKMPICMSVFRVLNKDSQPADEIQKYLRTLANSEHLNAHLKEIRAR
jgi:glycerol-3-phosphate dehydrogenase (NAD(P)+)